MFHLVGSCPGNECCPCVLGLHFTPFPRLLTFLRETTHISDEYKIHIKLVCFNANLNVTDNETTRTHTHISIKQFLNVDGQQTNVILNVARMVHVMNRLANRTINDDANGNNCRVKAVALHAKVDLTSECVFSLSFVRSYVSSFRIATTSL